MKKLEIVAADLKNKAHAEAVLMITDLYARDPMGLRKPLNEDVKKKLIKKLIEFPGTLCFIAFIDDEAAGVANCFYSFSTFNAKKVINIHDLAVNPKFRNKGIGQALLAAVEKRAADEDCCKVTLEVREDNRARNLYERHGFTYGEPPMLFMEKPV